MAQLLLVPHHSALLPRGAPSSMWSPSFQHSSPCWRVWLPLLAAFASGAYLDPGRSRAWLWSHHETDAVVKTSEGPALDDSCWLHGPAQGSCPEAPLPASADTATGSVSVLPPSPLTVLRDFFLLKRCFYKVIYLFLAVLCLRCCAWAVLQLRCMGFSLRRLLSLGSMGSRVLGLQELWQGGSRAQAQ